MFAYLLEFPLDKWVDASTEKTSAEDCTATTINERREKKSFKILLLYEIRHALTLSLSGSASDNQIYKGSSLLSSFFACIVTCSVGFVHLFFISIVVVYFEFEIQLFVSFFHPFSRESSGGTTKMRKKKGTK